MEFNLNNKEELPKTEEECVNLLKTIRERKGLICSSCGSTNQKWVNKGNKWICESCGHVTRLTSNTIMHHTHLPLMYWFKAFKWISDDPEISARQIQINLGQNRYQPIWEMVSKIKAVLKEKMIYDDELLLTALTETVIEVEIEEIDNIDLKVCTNLSDLLENSVTAKSGIKHKIY